MIKELTQFVQEVPSLIKEKAIEPKSGLHVLIDFDETGKGKIKGSERYLGNKHSEVSEFLKKSAMRQELSWMINTNKCFDLPAKGIHTASPFSIGFKIKLSKEDEADKAKAKELKKNKPTKEYKTRIIKDILERSDKYFERSYDQKFQLGEKELQKSKTFKNFIKNELTILLERDTCYTELNWNDYIIIYLDIPQVKYESFQNIYLADSLFNTDDYNIETANKIYGTSNFHNGFNSKKPFLTHQTASFDITTRISASEAKALSQFSAMAGKKLFPNPTPIFIEKRELTSEAIRIFHREEDKKHGHRKIIRELLKKEEELGNYYLLYYSGGVIRDFDFVPKFQYYLNSAKDEQGLQNTWKIHNVFELKEKGGGTTRMVQLKDVFDFERVVVRQLFNNGLVKIDEKKDEVSLRYFDDLDSKYYRPVYYTLMLKYRKPIYDFIYKSMRSEFGGHQFYDICMTGIFDDLKENKEYAIKTKLNILFSLYNHFVTTKNSQIMPSKIEEHKAELKNVLENEDMHFSSDEAYAFGAGQLIYYLLSQSEAGQKTHALLEPFLQKSNHFHFNDAISKLIQKYKHALVFNYQRMNSLAGEVLGFTPDKSVSDLRPTMLAGYFCPNIFYRKSENESNKEQNHE